MALVDAAPPASLADRLVAERFAVADGELAVGDLKVSDLARRFGTPLFVYDAKAMRAAYARLSRALDGFAEVYFSLKANPNPAVARLFVTLGAGLEIASAGEYVRARAAGAAPGRILFAGPGKRRDELEHVISAGIGEIHVESREEIATVAEVAAAVGRTVAVAPRINPLAAVQGGAMRMGGVPAPFGFDEEDMDGVVEAIMASPVLELSGVHLFTGTQILDADILLTQWAHGLSVAARIAQRAGHPLATIDLGGGLGIPYFAGDLELDLDRLADGLSDLARAKNAEPLLREARVVVEPGRFLVGPAGLYVMRAVSVKHSRGTRFIVTDGGMHHHLAASGNLGQLIKRDFPIVAATRMDDDERTPCVVAGPLCTPLDTLARKAKLPALEPGDLIAVLQSGAYALSASPTGFLTHPMPSEVLVEAENAEAIRPRGSFEAPATVPM